MEELVGKHKFKIHQINDQLAEIATYIDKTTDFHIFDTKWLPSFPTKFVVVGATSKSSPTGFIEIRELNKDQLDVIKIVNTKSAARCCSFDAVVRNSSLAVGNFHGSLQIFDIENSDFPIYDVKAHKGIVNCLDGIGYGEGAEIVTGGQDGCIRVWDPRQSEPVCGISAIKKEDGGSGSRDCWTVTFADGAVEDDRVICAGFDNGDIKLIDLRVLKERWSHNIGSGICKLNCEKIYARTVRLVAGTVDGNVHILNLNINQLEKNVPDKIVVDPMSSIWSINYLPQGENIFASIGNSIKVWKHW